MTGIKSFSHRPLTTPPTESSDQGERAPLLKRSASAPVLSTATPTMPRSLTSLPPAGPRTGLFPPLLPPTELDPEPPAIALDMGQAIAAAANPEDPEAFDALLTLLPQLLDSADTIKPAALEQIARSLSKLIEEKLGGETQDGTSDLLESLIKTTLESASDMDEDAFGAWIRGLTSGLGTASVEDLHDAISTSALSEPHKKIALELCGDPAHEGVEGVPSETHATGGRTSTPADTLPVGKDTSVAASKPSVDPAKDPGKPAAAARMHRLAGLIRAMKPHHLNGGDLLNKRTRKVICERVMEALHDVNDADLRDIAKALGEKIDAGDLTKTLAKAIKKQREQNKPITDAQFSTLMAGMLEGAKNKKGTGLGREQITGFVEFASKGRNSSKTCLEHLAGVVVHQDGAADIARDAIRSGFQSRHIETDAATAAFDAALERIRNHASTQANQVSSDAKHVAPNAAHQHREVE